MTDPFIGEIRGFGGNFAPRGWSLCQGQPLSIAQNSALFSILGTTYGGDGVTTFALPDLRGRVPIQQGTGPGLSNYALGQQTGTETVTLNTTQMPSHNHALLASGEDAGNKNPSGQVLATTTTPAYVATPIDVVMNPLAINNTGGNQPHNNLQPLLAINFIIALVGIFPSRN
jgi:microcystin-dependent protein